MAKTAEIKYSLANLRKCSKKLFGIGSAAFDGATAGLDSSKTYSIEEAKAAVTEWLSKPVGKQEK